MILITISDYVNKREMCIKCQVCRRKYNLYNGRYESCKDHIHTSEQFKERYAN